MGQTLFRSLTNLLNYQDEQELKCLYQRVNIVEEDNQNLNLIKLKKKKNKYGHTVDTNNN